MIPHEIERKVVGDKDKKICCGLFMVETILPVVNKLRYWPIVKTNGIGSLPEHRLYLSSLPEMGCKKEIEIVRVIRDSRKKCGCINYICEGVDCRKCFDYSVLTVSSCGFQPVLIANIEVPKNKNFDRDKGIYRWRKWAEEHIASYIVVGIISVISFTHRISGLLC